MPVTVFILNKIPFKNHFISEQIKMRNIYKKNAKWLDTIIVFCIKFPTAASHLIYKLSISENCTKVKTGGGEGTTYTISYPYLANQTHKELLSKQILKYGYIFFIY